MNEVPSGIASVATERVANIAVVRASGELDGTTVEGFSKVLDRVVIDSVAAVVVDLTEVVFFGSAGVSALLQLHQTSIQRRLRVYVVCGPLVRRPIQLTGIDRVLRLRDSLEDALREADVEDSRGGAEVTGLHRSP
ncbi:MAG: STAS domain-containing protein [Kutzneria sp.]|nr:STAS domain-containing protein [Kutzneria sp.]